jgi:hypothetical protein
LHHFAKHVALDRPFHRDELRALVII